MYDEGQGVEQDHAEAVRLYRLAADQGNMDGQSNLGISYAKGEGVTQDLAAAARWYRLAADQGHATAQYGLGRMYDFGQSVAQDHAEAARLYRLAADQGHTLAQYYLGLSYANGEGVTQNYAEAARWYRLAADQGHAGARINLGFQYYKGLGVRQDDAAATGLYRLVAEQGHASGQYHLGLSYEEGRSVEQDYAMAARLYSLSAAQNYDSALNNLGVLYQTGNGVPRDYVAAHALYTLAAQQDEEVAAENRDDLEAKMSPEQIAEAQRLVARWRPAGEVEQSPDFKQGLLWRVESPDGAVSHVFGTMHSTHPEVASPPLALRLVLDTADSLSLEVVDDEKNMGRLAQMILLPEGTRLVDITGQDLFNRLAAVFEAYGVPADGLQRLKPWAVWTMLLQTPDEAARRSADGPARLILDDVLEKRAKSHGIATYGLETVDEQVALLAGDDEAHHLAMLEAMLSREGQVTAASERRQLYLSGDLGGLYWPVTIAGAKAPAGLVQDFVERVILNRNRTMVDRMAKRLKSGNAVIAVGALHLHGEEGIPALLARQGYKVSRAY